MLQQLLADDGNIMGGGIVILGRQTVAVGKMRVLQAKLLGLLIHQIHKSALRPGQLLGHSHRSVITRGHGNALEHFIHSHFFAGLQKNLRPAHRRGIFTCPHLVSQLQSAFIQRFDGQQHRHDFGNACRRQLVVAVLLIDHGARVRIHKNRGARSGCQIHSGGFFAGILGLGLFLCICA
ncbi:hypothetical protein D3C75_743630 [compost metagenome]